MPKYLPLQGTQFTITFHQKNSRNLASPNPKLTQFTIIFSRKIETFRFGTALELKKSKDGCIKLWDGVSHRCYSTLERAHDGYEVCSVQFTKNGKFLLTSGKDSICRLWEISTSRVIHQFTGAELSGRQMHRSNACFNHTEEHVMFPCKYQPLSVPVRPWPVPVPARIRPTPVRAQLAPVRTWTVPL